VLEDCTAAYPLRVLSLRYFNPIGADPQLRTGLQTRRPTHLLGQMIMAAENDQEFLLTGVDWPTRDGSGIRDYIHVWDLALAHVQALRRFDQLLPIDGSPKYEVINLGTGNGTTVKEFVAAFNAVAPTPLRVRETGPRPGDVVGSYTRTDKARAALDWEPHYSIADGIRDSMRWSAVRDSRLDG
jgi:UDP-glucose 4-epimerase